MSVTKVFTTTVFKNIDTKICPQFVKDFLHSPDVSSLKRYDEKIFIKKFNTNGYPRLVFLEEIDEVGNNILYVPRKLFLRHEEYDDFFQLKKDIILNKMKYSDSEQKEINEEFASLNRSKELPRLPNEMKDIESQRDFSNTKTSYVFEMEEWVDHFKDAAFEDDKKQIFETIQSLVIDKKYPAPDAEGWITIPFAEKKEIICRVHDSNEHAYFYLFDIAIHGNKSLLNDKYLQLSDLQLSKQARKGYPDWILYGEFADWKKLENDDEANLALSQEEIDVLNSTPYPYFINGLAGSGKSTILYYLFAHAFTYRSTRNMELLFLSYSKKLIQKAQIVVKALLRTNPSYSGFKLDEKEEKKLSECFYPFQEFLISKFLTSEDEIERFSQTKHLNYEKFKKLYKEECKLPESNNYNATIVWSVIRSFIKGRKYDSYFTVKEYDAIQRDDKTVDTKDFDIIHKIWKNWYKQYEENYWDDLDLVRYVLKKIENASNIKKYDIIYCDEAQDFTPIENRLILQLSKYTEYDLSYYKKIPIAYAGDPNQTISPTGFSWTRLKDIFSQSFKDQVGDFISLKDKTLNNNYRSKRTVVEFANSLQYIRKHFLTSDPLQPQEQWNPQENALPGFFYIDTDADEQFVAKGFDKAECIITGADGEYELQFNSNELTPESTALNDSLLCSIENKTKLYTAISSKGLEFKAVILYKFADNLPSSFSRILNNQQIINESEKYELAHFFTKLYIAVSRAKELLYIVDTESNFERFWSYFVDNVFVNELMNKWQDAAVWKDKTGGIEIGKKEEFLHRLEQNFNPAELAMRIFSDAKLSQDAKDMRRAAGYFAEANRNKDSEICKAYVLLYENDFQSAGEKFLDLGDYNNATLAFWKGQCWNSLIENSSDQQYKQTALFMTGQKSLVEYIKLDNIIDYYSTLDETWKKVVVKIGHEAVEVAPEFIAPVCAFIERLIDKGFLTVRPTLADLYFKAKRYHNAVELWDDLKNVEHEKYYKSKCEICESTSELIFWKHKLREDKDIVKKWGAAEDIKNLSLNDQAQQIIFDILLQTDYEMAVKYPYPRDEKDKFNRLFNSGRVYRKNFLQSYLIKDFSVSKFLDFADKIKLDTYGFEDVFNKDTFDMIFSLTDRDETNGNKPYWLYFFTDLRDSDGKLIVKYDELRNALLESLSDALKKRDDYNLASCFLDCLFSYKEIDFLFADKYWNTIRNIFISSRYTIGKDDFIRYAARNYYFKESKLNDIALDNIKDKANNYAITKIKNLKEVKSLRKSDIDDVKTICSIFESTISFEDRAPEYDKIIVFYEKLLRIKNFKPLNNFFVDKLIINKLYNNHLKKSDCLGTLKSDLEKNKRNITALFETLSRVDSINVLGALISENSPELGKVLINIAFLFYKHRILLSDLWILEEDRNAKINQSKKFLKTLCSKKVSNEIRKKTIDEYFVKLIAFMVEQISNATEAAKFYDGLISKQEVKKYPELLRYLKQRALYKYQFLGAKTYTEKQRDYQMDVSFSRIPEYPVIVKEKPTLQATVIKKDCTVDGYDIELIHKRQKITFVRDNEEILVISKGNVESKDKSVKVQGSMYKLPGKVDVVAESAYKCTILSKGKTYVVNFEKNN